MQIKDDTHWKDKEPDDEIKAMLGINRSIKQNQKITAKDIETRFENTVYRAVVGILELLEDQGMIVGSGHNIAQDIAAYAKTKLDDRMRIAHFSFTEADFEILRAFMSRRSI